MLERLFLLLLVCTLLYVPTEGYSQRRSCSSNPDLELLDSVFCNAPYLFLRSSVLLKCSEIQTTDFILTAPSGKNIRIVGYGASRCADTAVKADSLIQLYIDPPIEEKGVYRLEILPNSLRDTCDNIFGGVTLFSAFWANLPIQFSINPRGNTYFCEGGQPVALSVSHLPLKNPKYQWSPSIGLNNNGIPNPTAQVNRTTTYTITISSDSCAQTSQTILVEWRPKPNASFTGKQTICSGEETEITLQGAQTYFWEPIFQWGASITLSPNQTTIYKVTPFTNGCAGDTVYIPVTVSPVPSANFSAPQNVCVLETFEIQYTGNTPNANFEWKLDDATLVSFTPPNIRRVYYTQQGLHFIRLTATIGGCQRDSTLLVTAHPKIDIDAGNYALICDNQDGVTLEGKITEGTFASFDWQPKTGLVNSNSLRPYARPSRTTTYTLTAIAPYCKLVSDTVTVRVLPAPKLSSSLQEINHCIGSSGSLLAVTVSPSNQRYAIEWLPASGLDNPNILSPKANPSDTITYSLTVTDPNGCKSNPLSIRVNVVALPKVVAGKDTTVCTNSPGFLFRPIIIGTNKPEEDFRYEWQPPVNLSSNRIKNPFVRIDSTRVYTLKVTSTLTGCSSNIDNNAKIKITVQKPPIARAGPDITICRGDSVQIGDLPLNGLSGYRFKWQPKQFMVNDTLARPFVKPAHNQVYRLFVVADGCTSAVDSMQVFVQERPTPFIARKVREICPDDTVHLEAQVINAQPRTTYFWTPRTYLTAPNSLKTIAQPSKTITYSFYAANNGCVSYVADTVKIVVLPAPTVEADANFPKGHIICRDSTLLLNAKVKCEPPCYIIWRPSTFLNDSTIAQPLAKPTRSMRYFITVNRGKCSITDSVNVFVVPKVPAKASADTLVICWGDSVRLHGSGGFGSPSFHWQPGESLYYNDSSTVWARPFESTTYTLRVTESGCLGYDTIRIEVLTQPYAQFSSEKNIGCDPHKVSFKFEGQKAQFWYWDFGDGHISNLPEPHHTYSDTGRYLVRLILVSDGYCKDTAYAERWIEIKKSVKAQFLMLNNDTLHIPNAHVDLINTSKNYHKILWDFGNGEFSTDEKPRFKYTSNGHYTILLIAEDSLGCVDTASKRVVIMPSQVNIPNVFTPNGDGWNDQWVIDYIGIESFELQVFDRWGKALFATSNPKEHWNARINNSGSDVMDGVYFYILKIGRMQYSGQVTVLR